MKKNIKATKMQLAKKPSVKSQISREQPKKASKEIEQLAERLKRSVLDHAKMSLEKASVVKEDCYYVGIDLGD